MDADSHALMPSARQIKACCERPAAACAGADAASEGTNKALQASEAGMRWDIPDDRSDEAPTDEDGSSLWGSDSEDSDGSIGHSLTGAQRPFMLCLACLSSSVTVYVPTTLTPAS